MGSQDRSQLPDGLEWVGEDVRDASTRELLVIAIRSRLGAPLMWVAAGEEHENFSNALTVALAARRSDGRIGSRL